MDATKRQSERERIAEMGDDELEAELEAAIEIKDEAERQGGKIRYFNQTNYIVLLRDELGLRETLTTGLEDVVAQSS